MSAKISCLIALGVWCFGGLLPANADDVSWTNTASGLFSNPKNWSAGPDSVNRVPAVNDDVGFLWPNLTVTVDGVQSTHSLVLSEPITLQIDGAYDVAEVFAQVAIPFIGNGTLTIGRATSLAGCTFSGITGHIDFFDLPGSSLSSGRDDPIVITDGAKIISDDGKVAGKVIVQNAAEWEHLGDLYDTLAGGLQVPGVLAMISGGGVVRFHQVSLAQAEVEGGGRFFSGESGVVLLNLRNGGATTSDRAAMPYGNATIDGAGSTWSIGSGFRMTNAFLTITNGGLLNCGDAVVGDVGMVTITGASSRFLSGDFVDVVREIDVLNGGTLSAPEITISRIAGGFGSVLVSGEGSRAVAARGLFVGDGGSASLNVLQGGQVEAAGAILGVAPGSFGNMLIQDSGSAFVLTGALGLGDEGTGNLTVKGGARVQLAASGAFGFGLARSGDGTLELSDRDSTFDARGLTAQVGGAGAGTLRIEEGARFLARGLEIGQQSGSTGVVTVSSIFASTASLELQDDLVVAAGGGGSLSLQASGNADAQITAGTLTVGQHAPGTLALSGQRALMNIRGTVALGDFANADVNISQGAQLLIGGDFSIARNAAQGTVSIEGVGSLLEVADESAGMIVGQSGTGILHIRQGGSVHAPVAAIGAQVSGLITIDDPGSVLNVTDNLFVGGLEHFPSPASLSLSAGGLAQIGRLLCVQREGIVQFGEGGTINVGAPQTVAGRVLQVSASGVLGGDGTIAGAQVIVRSGGRLAPGCSIGALSIQGNVEFQEGSTLEMEISGGSAGTEYDVVNVSGSTTLGGTLELHFVDGFAPIKGQGFDLMHVGTNALGNLPPVQVFGLASGFQPQLTLARGVLRMTALNDGVASSAPRLSPVVANGKTTISWPAASAAFTLQRATNLLAPNWLPITNASNPFVITINPGQNEFFRLAK